MKALGKTPVTKLDYIKRIIAIHLDESFISDKKTGMEKLIVKDFDFLVDKMGESILRINEIPDDKFPLVLPNVNKSLD